MQLNEKILTIYPELAENYNIFNPKYTIQDDSDGNGPYIKEWNYYKPRPTNEQLEELN